MIIYNDLSFGSELCSDSYPMSFPSEYDGEVMCLTSKKVKETETGEYNIGQNASQEEATDDLESSSKEDLDIAIAHHLEDASNDLPTVKEMQKYLKKWGKRVCDLIVEKAKSEEEGAENKKRFQACASKLFMELKNNFDDYQFYRPNFVQSGAEDYMDLYYIPVRYNQDTNNYTFFLFKQAITEVKY